MTPINNQTTNSLTINITQLKNVYSANKQNYLDNNQFANKNTIDASILTYQVKNAGITFPTLEASIISNNYNVFKDILYADKNIQQEVVDNRIVTKYIKLIIYNNAKECLVELLNFLTRKKLNKVLEKQPRLYSYICDNQQLRELVLKNHYFVIGYRGIYDILFYAISVDNKADALRAFEVLLTKFPLHYASNKCTSKYYNPIIYAIEQDKFNIFQELIKIAPRFFVTLPGNNITSLIAAASNKNSSFLECLLQHKHQDNVVNYQEQLKMSLSIAIDNKNSENIKILIDHAPLIVFEKLANKDETIIATLFKKHPDYFVVAIDNKIIANHIINPIFFNEFIVEKNHVAYKLLVSLKKQTVATKLKLDNNKKILVNNSNSRIVDALVDYKVKTKKYSIDYINVDSYYIENVNSKMLDLVSSILPKLNNLAVYVKSKQYYKSSIITNKVFSYGDENASISLINWLIKLGVPQIKIIISPPDNSTPDSRRYLSKAAKNVYKKQKLFCLKKISRLFPLIKYNSIKPQKITTSGVKLHVGFVDDNSFMDNYFYTNNHVSIKKYNGYRKLIKYNGVVISFSAPEFYNELVADDLIIIKPFAFAKKCEQINTDLYVDAKNKSLYSNINSLANTTCSIIPEVKTNIELKYNSENYILEWLTAALANIEHGSNIANIINLIYLYFNKNKIDHSLVYGIHHNNVKDNAYNIIRDWIAVLDSFRSSRDTATVLSLFSNNLFLDIDVITYNRNDIIFLSLYSNNILADFSLAIAEKKIIIFNFSPLPKQVFQFLIKNANLPMLTEGANTTSYLLQEGMPYLSLLPDYTTHVPYSMGDPLQSFLIESLSYKLVMSSYFKMQLKTLHSLVEQKQYIAAKDFIESLILQDKKHPHALSYLWKAPTDDSITAAKITAYKLITKGEKLSPNAYNILLQALTDNLDSIALYIKQITTKGTQEKHHVEMIKSQLQNNFNNVVITSLYQFFKAKHVSKN
jgi:hypothetical protein